MKTKKTLLFVTTILLGLWMVSCEKNGDNVEPIFKDIVPSKIVYYYGTSTSTPNETKCIEYKFEYDKQGRISKYHYEYFDNGISRNFISTVTLTYDDQGLTSATSTRSDMPGDYSWGSSFYIYGSEVHTNPGDNNPVKLDLKYRALSYGTHASGYEWFRRKFEYDLYGNATYYSWHPNSDDDTQQFMFAFDNKKGVFRNVKTHPWYITTQMDLGGLEYLNLFNNAIIGRDDKELRITYSNIYNSNNYPEKITRTTNIDGDELVSYEIEYFNLN